MFDTYATTHKVLFSKRKHHNDLLLQLEDPPIEVVKEVKLLGVIFDNKRSFTPYKKNVKNVQMLFMELKLLQKKKKRKKRTLKPDHISLT